MEEERDPQAEAPPALLSYVRRCHALGFAFEPGCKFWWRKSQHPPSFHPGRIIKNASPSAMSARDYDRPNLA